MNAMEDVVDKEYSIHVSTPIENWDDKFDNE